MSEIFCIKCKKAKKDGLIASISELNECCSCDDKEISEMLRTLDKPSNEAIGLNFSNAIKPNIISQFLHAMTSTMQELREFELDKVQLRQLFDDCFNTSKNDLGL